MVEFNTSNTEKIISHERAYISSLHIQDHSTVSFDIAIRQCVKDMVIGSSPLTGNINPPTQEQGQEASLLRKVKVKVTFFSS